MFNVEDRETPTFERCFVSGPHGQIHLRIAQKKVASRHPLILFHPTPASGNFFAEFIEQMATDRMVIAMDTPGYGDSARPEHLPNIEDYAKAASTALKALGFPMDGEKKIDALGYHTGGLIAVELARSQPNLVRRLVLPGLPFFQGEAKKEAYDNTAIAPPDVKRDGSHLLSIWEHATMAVEAGVPLDRAQEFFAEEIKSYPYTWWGYHAAFTYESEIRFAETSQPVLLISTTGSLQQETAAALPYFQNSEYVHLENYSYGVFVLGSQDIALEVRKFLDN